MTKLYLLLSLFVLLIVALGTAFMPHSPLFWIASDTRPFMVMRILLGAVIILQLVTRPPRHVAFRIVAAIIAGTAAIWTIRLTYTYHMEFLDTLAFLAASISILVTALERKALPADDYYGDYAR